MMGRSSPGMLHLVALSTDRGKGAATGTLVNGDPRLTVHHPLYTYFPGDKQGPKLALLAGSLARRSLSDVL